MSEDRILTHYCQLFHQGHYIELVAKLGRNRIDISNQNFETLTALQIGALTFIGEIQESKTLFKLAISSKKMSPEILAQCHFYLGIGCMRKSDYKNAASWFSKNLKLLRNEQSHRTDRGISNSKIEYFAFQGAAFYRFFCGHFSKVIKTAELAYNCAFAMNFEYGKILSLDLLGYALIQLGSIRRGFYELERALTLAQKIGNGGIVSAIQITMIVNRSRFGLNMNSCLRDLSAAMESLDPEDTYSRTELYLETIRHLLLRGMGTDAQIAIENASELVYKHENRRQSATYNLRLAHLLLLRGEGHASLALIRSVRTHLVEKIDHDFLLRVRGLESKICRSLNLESPKISLQSSIKNDTYFNSRIQSRLENKFEKSYPQGEDPLGDLLDRISRNPKSAIHEVKSLGLWGLLPPLFGIRNGENCIILGPLRNECIIVSGADVLFRNKGLTSPMRKLISLLSGEGFKMKEPLIRKTWGYSYNPEIHDRLLHATVGKLRSLLGFCSHWVEWSENGYRLNAMVHIHSHFGDIDLTETNETTKLKKIGRYQRQISEPLRAPPSASLWNQRQIKILQKLKENEFIGVDKYSRIYKISSMTACRDLTALFNAGILTKVGRARATVYMLRSSATPKEQKRFESHI